LIISTNPDSLMGKWRTTPDLDAFIQALPKTETHLHVEGALPYDSSCALDPDRYGPGPGVPARSYRYPTFPEFEQTLLDHALPWFTSAERYHEAARVIFAGTWRQNVRYVETSFHLHGDRFIHVPGPEIIAAIRPRPRRDSRCASSRACCATPTTARCARTIDSLENWDDLAGVDLHGFEQMPTEPWSARIWERPPEGRAR
jgi:hypothetical protein